MKINQFCLQVNQFFIKEKVPAAVDTCKNVIFHANKAPAAMHTCKNIIFHQEKAAAAMLICKKCIFLKKQKRCACGLLRPKNNLTKRNACGRTNLGIVGAAWHGLNFGRLELRKHHPSHFFCVILMIMMMMIMMIFVSQSYTFKIPINRSCNQLS